MKVAIQGMGEVPASVEFVLERERPDVTYILCSESQLKHVAFNAGYTGSNEQIIAEAAKRTGTKVVYERCDPFDPKSIMEAVRRIMGRVKERDTIVVNYASGSAAMRLILGLAGVSLSTQRPAKVIYAIRYRDGFTLTADHTKALKEIFEEFAKYL